MRKRYLHGSVQRTQARLGTNGLLLALLVIGTCFAYFRWQKFGASLADVPLLIAIVMAITSSTNLQHREAWVGKLKPILIAIYVYIVVALLPLLSGGGFIWVQLAKDLFSFAIFPVTFLTIARVVDEQRINRVLRIAITLSVLIVCFTVLSGTGSRSSGLLGSPNLAGNWAAAFVMLLLLIEVPENRGLRIGLVSVLVVASFRMASLGGILCILTSLAFWLPRRSKNLTVGKQVLPFLIGIGAPTILQAFDTFTGLNRYGRSSQGRLSIWGEALKVWFEKPLGLGIGNFADPNLGLTVAPEAHNDYISSLVELGILGPIAIGGICLAISMAGGLRTRTMVVFYLVSAISHNSINFRHIWVCMAICFAYDVLPQLQKPGAETASPEIQKAERRKNRSDVELFKPSRT